MKKICILLAIALNLSAQTPELSQVTTDNGSKFLQTLSVNEIVQLFSSSEYKQATPQAQQSLGQGLAQNPSIMQVVAANIGTNSNADAIYSSLPTSSQTSFVSSIPTEQMYKYMAPQAFASYNPVINTPLFQGITNNMTSAATTSLMNYANTNTQYSFQVSNLMYALVATANTSTAQQNIVQGIPGNILKTSMSLSGPDWTYSQTIAANITPSQVSESSQPNTGTSNNSTSALLTMLPSISAAQQFIIVNNIGPQNLATYISPSSSFNQPLSSNILNIIAHTITPSNASALPTGVTNTYGQPVPSALSVLQKYGNPANNPSTPQVPTTTSIQQAITPSADAMALPQSSAAKPPASRAVFQN